MPKKYATPKTQLMKLAVK